MACVPVGQRSFKTVQEQYCYTSSHFAALRSILLLLLLLHLHKHSSLPINLIYGTHRRRSINASRNPNVRDSLLADERGGGIAVAAIYALHAFE